MIEGHDILCFAPGPWDDIWRNRHQIMTRLARANRVLYIEPWPELRPTLRKWRSGQLSWADVHGPRLRRVQENLHVFSPALWAPRVARFPLSAVADAAYMAFLRRVLKRLRFEKPILWLFMPETAIFVGRFDEKLVIYHIVDEYAGYSGISATWRPVVQQMEEQLARQADLVFVTSPDLMERKRAFNESIVLVPNAVDYEMFAAAGRASNAPIPADMADLRPPIAGYVGAINDKLNLALLLQVALQCARPDGEAVPRWSFVLVGPVTIQTVEGQRALEALRALPNVHFLGSKSVAELPRYITACSVCLLPYQINDWTKHIDSLKLYEYLACGKPVIATAVPAARRFSQVVTIVTDPQEGGSASSARSTYELEFLSGMNKALGEDGPALQAARRQIAAQNTWEQRVEALSAAIEERLPRRASPAPPRDAGRSSEGSERRVARGTDA